MTKIANVLEAHPQVQTVSTNVKTGSIVIHHDLGKFESALNSLKDLGVIVSDIGGIEIPQGQTQVSANLTSALSDLNR